MNIKILIACHKKCDVPKDEIYLPVHVGAYGKEQFGFTPDNTGENISNKNPVFCELTGLYWAWKNLECDVIGLSHYRRYFTMKSKAYIRKHENIECVLTGKELRNLLLKYTVLVPKKRHYYIETIYNHYSHTFDGRQLDITRDILLEKYDSYVQDYDLFMKGTSGYMFNMFIMPKPMFSEYCEWLFDILFELEKRYSTEGMTDFEKRYIGRVSERLFNVWLNHEIRTGRLRESMVHEVPYMYFGKIDWTRKITSFLSAKFLHKKYDRSF